MKHYLTLTFIDLTPIRRRFFFRRISLCLPHVENIWSAVDIYLLEGKKETCVKGHMKVWEALRNAIMTVEAELNGPGTTNSPDQEGNAP